MLPEPQKWCPRCCESLPVSNFSRSKSTKDGRYGFCKACDKKKQTRYRAENEKELKEKEKRRGITRRTKKVDPEIPGTKKCHKCGEWKSEEKFPSRGGKRYSPCKQCTRVNVNARRAEYGRKEVYVPRHLRTPEQQERARESDRIHAARRRKDSPEIVKARLQLAAAKRRAIEYGLEPGNLRSRHIFAIFGAFGYACIYCDRIFSGMTDDALSLEHLRPLRGKGTNAIDNLAPACLSCNVRRQDTPIEQFVESYRRLQHICETSMRLREDYPDLDNPYAP